MKRCIGVLICLIMSILLGACSIASKGERAKEYTETPALIDDQGVGHLLCDSGKVLTIPNAKLAWVTADRNLLLWISESGCLYRINYSGEKTDLTKAEKISSNVAELMTANNLGLSFVSTSGELYRVLFADNSTVKVVDSVDNVATAPNMNLFISSEGKVYYLPHEAEDIREIGSYSGKTKFWPLSEMNGEIVWVDYNSGAKTDTAYYFNGANNVKLYEMQNSGYGSSVHVETSRTGSYVAVYSYYDQVLLLKAPNKDFITINFNGDIVSGIYTYDDLLGVSEITEIDGIYVAVEQDETESIYWVTLDGDKEKILSKTLKFEVSNGILYYLTSDNTLYATKAAKAVTSSGEQLVNDVDDYVVSSDYIYYMKDTEQVSGTGFDGVGTLYAYTLKDREPVKVATDVYASYYDESSIYCELYCADDGKTVLYLKNPENHDYNTYGSLFLYTYGSKEPERIMGEVNEYYIYSLKTKFSSDSIIFAQYIDKELSETSPYRFDWYFYNGKEAVSVAKNAY